MLRLSHDLLVNVLRRAGAAVPQESLGVFHIDPSLLQDDKDMLEDLVAAAFNDAVRRAETVSNEKMGKLTAGMPLPPGMKLPF